MRLVRYGEAGQEKAGMLDADGALRSVSPIVDDWSYRHLDPLWQSALDAIEPSKLPLVEGPVRFGLPLSDFRQVIAIGLNYSDHAEEANMALPSHPMVFQKALGSLTGPDDPITLPAGSSALDWEAELGIVIGRGGRAISEAQALDHVGGYVLAADMSERDWQFNMGGLHNKGKSHDSFTPVGPWLVTADEIADPQALSIRLSVNGQLRQHASTGTMIASVAQIIAHVSKFQSLLAGDLILTGTPAGVGFGMKPPQYLNAGDEVRLDIEGLGAQRHDIVAEAVT